MSVPTISPLAAALRAKLMPDVELILAGLNPVPLASDKPGATRDAPAAAQPHTESAPQKPPPPPAVQALDTARQTDAGRQAGLGPLLADLEQAVRSPALPPQVRAAADKVLALQTPIEAEVTPQTIKTAVARSGLFLEPRLAQGRAPPPDLKSALLVLRQVLRAAVPAPAPQIAETAGPTPQPQPGATLATPPQSGTPAPATPHTPTPGLAQTYAPPSPAFLAEVEAATHPQTTAGATTPAAPPIPGAPPQTTLPMQAAQSPTPPNAPASPSAGQQPVSQPPASPVVAAPVETALPHTVPVPPAQAAATPLPPSGLHEPLLPPQARALPAAPLPAPLPVEAEGFERPVAEPLTSVPAARADKSAPPVQADPAPPPPMKGAPPQAQRAAHATLSADADPAAMVRHLERATSGALARTELLQLASLPDAPRADGVETRTNTWLFEIPLATAQGPAVAQFEIEKDAQGLGSAGEAAAWRTKFSIDVEPAGRVHALVVMAGGKTSITLWAERLETVQRLRLTQADLAGTLEAEVAVYPGAPTAPRPAPGRFLDASS